MNNLSFLIRKVSNIRESGSKGVGVKLGDMCGRLEASPPFPSSWSAKWPKYLLRKQYNSHILYNNNDTLERTLTWETAWSWFEFQFNYLSCIAWGNSSFCISVLNHKIGLILLNSCECYEV